MTRVEELMLKLADGDIADAELTELRSLLEQDPEAFRIQISILELEAELRGSRENLDVAQKVVDAVGKIREDRIENGVLDKIRSQRPPTWRRAKTRRVLRANNFPWFAWIAAALLLALAGLWMLTTPRQDEASKLAERRDGVPNPTPANEERPSPTPAENHREPGTPPVVPAPPEPKPAPEREKTRAEEPVPVKEPPVPAPAPPARPDKEPLPERRTVTSIARLERVAGDVFAVPPAPAARVQVREGHEMKPDEVLITGGPGSLAVVAQGDAFRMELAADSEIRILDLEKILLARGKLEGEAVKAEKVLTTVHAELRLSSARFALSRQANETRLEMRQGTALLTNLLNGTSFQAKAGEKHVIQGKPELDQKQIDAAIERGIRFLREQNLPPAWDDGLAGGLEEFVLWTFIHAGVPETDPVFQKHFKKMMDAKLERTYQVSLKAMVLEALDRVGFQNQIAQCAVFLVDNQCANGQWPYGEPTPGIDAIPLGKTAVATGPRKKDRDAKPLRIITIRKTREGPARGDNSNAMYATLGLRACHDAGIRFPAEVVDRAIKSWRDTQHDAKEAGKKDVATGRGRVVAPRGWCYDGSYPGSDGHGRNAYASMTAGGVGSLTLLHYLSNRKWKDDGNILAGLEWLRQNFSVSENAGPPAAWTTMTSTSWGYYYYLYALERAGILYGSDRIGDYAWYALGANQILKSQKADGTWLGFDDGNPVKSSLIDTCFAILFLKRATKELMPVASEDRVLKRPVEQNPGDK